MTLGKKIEGLRTKRGWSQHELARQPGVRQALLSELERGKKTDTTGSVLARLARTLGVSVDVLVGTFDSTLAPLVPPRGQTTTVPAPARTTEEPRGGAPPPA